MKKTLLLVLFALLSWCNAQAQSHFQFGLNLYPNFSQAIISNNGSLPQWVDSTYRALETGKFSYSGGFFARYSLSKHFDMSLGADYVNTGFANKLLALTDSSGTNIGTLKTYFSQIQVAIPLNITVKFPLGKGFSLGITAGSGVRIWVAESTKIKYEYNSGTASTQTQNSTNAEEVNRINIPVRFGFRLERNFGKHFSLFAQPLAQYELLGLNKDVAIQRNILDYGLNIGFVWQ